ncbi:MULTISPECIES: hypothetical protein [unclassified Streptomyces]|uniref:hypothetical protein n=1 Tax=unclassified Streptomyces TaxID=2593676 RepID=UPI0036F5E06A
MTARAGESFDTARAVSSVDAALATPLPESGPTTDEGEPVTGEWVSTRGEGFLLLPLWESDALTGVYGSEWDEAEATAEAHLSALTTELDRRWGPHRTVSMRVPLLRRGTGDPLPEPFHTLSAKDCYGDLSLWGPLPTPAPRWAAVSLNQSDGDAPMILTALISTHPLTDPADPPRSR